MPDQPNAVASIMASVATRMRAEFEATKVMMHEGAKGAARERIVHSVIAPYLPGHLQVAGSAEIIAVDGTRSGQCDIVIFDRRTPPLLDMENHRLIPSECVYLVIEVKSNLTKRQLFDACDKLSRVKKLPKVAADQGRDFQPFMTTAGMIFAFESPNINTVARNLVAWASEHRVTECPDSVWALGKGFVSWMPGLEPRWLQTSTEQPKVVGVNALENDITLAFMTRLNAHLNRAAMPPFNLDYYAGAAATGQIAGQSDDCWDEEAYRAALASSWQVRPPLSNPGDFKNGKT